MEDALSRETIPSVHVLYNSERMPHTTIVKLSDRHLQSYKQESLKL